MESFEEKQRIAVLMDLYDGLLTDRQRELMALHYREDLSYGEIADGESISRQAVHDAIQHGRKTLIRIEEELRLTERLPAAKKQQKKEDDTSTEAPNWDEVKTLVVEMSKMLKDDMLFDTNPLKRKLKRLEQVVGLGESK